MVADRPTLVAEILFKVEVDGITIGEFAECSGLTVEYDVEEYEEGGQNSFVHKLRGRAKYPNLVLKRGFTTDDALVRWFNDCQEATQLKGITISLLDPAGEAVRTWAFAGAWPVKWEGPGLNAGSTNPAMETLEIAHQGFASA